MEYSMAVKKNEEMYMSNKSIRYKIYMYDKFNFTKQSKNIIA